MKVVYITVFRPECGGGEGRVAHELAEQFSLQHDVALICPHDQTAFYGTEGGLQVLGIRSAGKSHVSVPILSQRNVDRVANFLDEFQPEIVHAHEPVSLCLVGQIWAKMNGVPFVHTAHVLPSKFLDFGTVEVVPAFRGALTQTVARQLLAGFYRECDAIVALNDVAVEDIRGFGYEGRILEIRNGRNLAQYSACQTADRSASARILTFVGFLSERKNQAFLIDALAHLPSNYRLQLIGDSLEPAYRAELAARARAKGLDNVAFVGQVQHALIPSYLEMTHAFVSASKMEVQSLVVLEALASGTPVVGLSNETIDELVDDGVGRRLDRDCSPQEFAACVREVCESSEAVYKSMCQAARERVEPFDWASVVELTAEAYQSLSKGSPSPSGHRPRRMLDIVGQMPPEEVRRASTERVIALNWPTGRRQQVKQWHLLREARKISIPMWVLGVVTVVASVGAYVVARSRMLSLARHPADHDAQAVSNQDHQGENAIARMLRRSYGRWRRSRKGLDGSAEGK